MNDIITGYEKAIEIAYKTLDGRIEEECGL